MVKNKHMDDQFRSAGIILGLNIFSLESIKQTWSIKEENTIILT